MVALTSCCEIILREDRWRYKNLTLERFYIFWETKLNNQINDRLTIKPNIIFETIVQKDTHRGIPNTYKHLSSNN
jgi:hypothetical protein